MQQLLALIPHFIGATAFFGTLAVGLTLIIVSREQLVERFARLQFALTQRAYDEHPLLTPKRLLLAARSGGILSILLSLLVAWLLLRSLLG